LPGGNGVTTGGPVTTAGAPTGCPVGGVATGGPTGTEPGGKPGGAATAGGGSFGQVKNRSPVGSIRGTCHEAQPANIIAHAAIAAKETRVGMWGNISTGRPCAPCKVCPASRKDDAREELWGWEAEKMIARPGNAPGARNRPAC